MAKEDNAMTKIIENIIEISKDEKNEGKLLLLLGWTEAIKVI